MSIEPEQIFETEPEPEDIELDVFETVEDLPAFQEFQKETRLDQV